MENKPKEPKKNGSAQFGWSSDFEDLEGKIAEWKAEAEGLESALYELQKQIDALDDENMHLDMKKEPYSQELVQERVNQQNLQDEYQALNNELSGKKSALESEKRMLAEHLMSAGEVSTLLEQSCVRIKYAEQDIAAKQTQAKQHQTLVDEKNQQMAKLEKQVSELDETITTNRKCLQEMTEERTVMREKKDRIKARITHFTKTVTVPAYQLSELQEKNGLVKNTLNSLCAKFCPVQPEIFQNRTTPTGFIARWQHPPLVAAEVTGYELVITEDSENHLPTVHQASKEDADRCVIQNVETDKISEIKIAAIFGRGISEVKSDYVNIIGCGGNTEISVPRPYQDETETTHDKVIVNWTVPLSLSLREVHQQCVVVWKSPGDQDWAVRGQADVNLKRVAVENLDPGETYHFKMCWGRSADVHPDEWSKVIDIYTRPSSHPGPPLYNRRTNRNEWAPPNIIGENLSIKYYIVSSIDYNDDSYKENRVVGRQNFIPNTQLGDKCYNVRVKAVCSSLVSVQPEVRYQSLWSEPYNVKI